MFAFLPDKQSLRFCHDHQANIVMSVGGHEVGTSVRYSLDEAEAPLIESRVEGPWHEWNVRHSSLTVVGMFGFFHQHFGSASRA